MNKSQILNILNSKGIKPTISRIAVFEKLSKMVTHPSVEEIYHSLKSEFPTISLATVYSILKIFEEKEIVSSMNYNNSSARYDLVREPHFHLYERKSDKIIDYINTDLQKLLDDYFAKNKIEGYSLLDIKMELIVEKKNK